METDYAVAPGEYIVEWMENNNISKKTMAHITGYDSERLEHLLTGKEPFTPETAEKFSTITGIPAKMYLRFETLYTSDVSRLGLIRGRN